MPFGRWFYNTEQLSQSEMNFGNFSILLLLRDFYHKKSVIFSCSVIYSFLTYGFYEGVYRGNKNGSEI